MARRSKFDPDKFMADILSGLPRGRQLKPTTRPPSPYPSGKGSWRPIYPGAKGTLFQRSGAPRGIGRMGVERREGFRGGPERRG